MPKSELKFVPNPILEKWYNTIINGGECILTDDNVIEFLKSLLNMKLDNMDPQLVKILPSIVKIYMKKWPHWDVPNSTKKMFNLQQFLHKSINIFITTDFQKLLTQMDEEQNNGGSCTSKSIAIAPYHLEIACTPDLLSTMFFLVEGEDVHLKPHSSIEWKDPTIPQLMNWPYIEITFNSPELKFQRTQATHYERQICYLMPMATETNDIVIENMEVYDKTAKKMCFNYRKIEDYLRQYLNIIKALPNCSPECYDEIHMLCHNFILDMKILQINGIVTTNNRILFKLGKKKYVRNKKLGISKDSAVDQVGYCEIFSPKMELLLHSFAPMKSTPHGSNYFQLDNAKHCLSNGGGLPMFLMPKISYKCTFCGVDGKKREEIIAHFRDRHRMEQPVRCVRCKLQYNVSVLAANRWDHHCTPDGNVKKT